MNTDLLVLVGAGLLLLATRDKASIKELLIKIPLLGKYFDSSKTNGGGELLNKVDLWQRLNTLVKDEEAKQLLTKLFPLLQKE